MESYINIKYIAASLLYSLLGLGIYAIGFYVVDKLTPGKLWEEIIERQNVALAIIVGSVSLGISLIIASAIQS